MINRGDLPCSHFGGSMVIGCGEDFANGVKVTPSASGNPTIAAFGDTAATSLELGVLVGSAVQQRAVYNAAAKTIVDGSATSLFDVACASGGVSGGAIDFLVRASDGTDHQVISGIAHYGMVNKAGTNTLTITYATANEAKAVSSGTLTLAFTFVTGTNKGTVKVQPTGSLTETVYTIEYTVRPIRGAVTIL
jgi:hypothetical protein